MPDRSPTSWKVKPFGLSQVSLQGSVLGAKRDRMLRYAREFPADRILTTFRTEAGLPTGGVLPPGGWDDATGLLRGHYSGHFLSMLAQAAAGTREQALQDKLDYLIDELGHCRDAMAASGRYSHPGYLAALPEDQFAKLERYIPYPGIWAPWYTCHKILAGLLDSHRLTGNRRALDLAWGIGRWAHARLSRTTPEQRRRMWALYIAGEYGGMNETLVELAVRTDDANMLDTARYFDNEPLLAACASNRDVLDGKHANQHIPQFLGYLSLFEATGERRYISAAENFWDMVVPHRVYSHGGTGQAEIFRARDAIAGSIIGSTNAETCAAYNMIKLARRLFFHSGDGRYLDQVERALFNQILGSRADLDSAEGPMVTYMLPVAPASQRRFGNLGTCCGGTGLESFTKLQEAVYDAAINDDELYVNLYVPSVLDWSERGISIVQRTERLGAESSRLIIVGSGTFTLKLRVPPWARRGFGVAINGTSVAIDDAPDRYLSVLRHWADGDTIEVTLPRRLRVERALDDPSLVTVFDGPVALVARDPSTDQLPIGDPGAARPVGAPHHYQLGSLQLVPLYEGEDVPYHLYLRDTTATV